MTDDRIVSILSGITDTNCDIGKPYGEYTGGLIKYLWNGDNIELSTKTCPPQIESFDYAIEPIRYLNAAPSLATPEQILSMSLRSYITLVKERETSTLYLTGRNKIIKYNYSVLELLLFGTATYNRDVKSVTNTTLHLSKSVFILSDPVMLFIKNRVLPMVGHITSPLVIGNCPNIVLDYERVYNDIFNVTQTLTDKIAGYGEEIATLSGSPVANSFPLDS